ncbi:MAG: hypothetical protein U0703_24405 [Anaerolineae bacterium]
MINDGSSDHTAAIAERCGAVVLNPPHNVGIGAAVQTGMIFRGALRLRSRRAERRRRSARPARNPAAGARPDRQRGLISVFGSRYIEDRGYITLACPADWHRHPRACHLRVVTRQALHRPGLRLSRPTAARSACARSSTRTITRSRKRSSCCTELACACAKFR